MTGQDIPLDDITAAPWNANRMDEPMRDRLLASIGRHGPVPPILVRRVADRLETVVGAQRLGALREERAATAPCIVLDDLADADARLILSVVLHRLGGSADITGPGDLAREVLAVLPADAVAALPRIATATAVKVTGAQAMQGDGGRGDDVGWAGGGRGRGCSRNGRGGGVPPWSAARPGAGCPHAALARANGSMARTGPGTSRGSAGVHAA
jgi:hypothetical protein